MVEELEELVEQVVNTGVAVALNFAENKSPPHQKVQPVSFDDKFQTLVRRSKITGNFKEKCYFWTTTLKTYDNTSSNEWDILFILNHQHPLETTKGHFASLKANTYIENLIIFIFSYDCAIYMMKWLEIIEPQNIKKSKYEWDNWTHAEVNHSRVEYASLILFDEMNRLRDRVIQESEAIRLSKPSAALLSLYCEFRSEDINSE
ncbi:hypothetical protein Ahy_A09g045897 [Arachis hypogaea]|uniref:Uncharacterized protein n=1 Tax=Arachis hypogaea TaxID=3818 RepID=A0A445BND2_ARAHY|nr:hypothetical protein Ahy_A09g045897 [Arachis hypogaea]